MIRLSIVLTTILITGCSSSTTTPAPAAALFADDDPRAALAASMSGNRVLAYRETWDVVSDGAEVSPGMIRLFYTRRVMPASDRAGGDSQGEPDYWNREHVWPQSYGLSGNAARSDVHNLVPADRTVNRSRSNKVFDDAMTPHHECTACRVSRDAWQPPAEVRGDVARIAFYLDVRYSGDGGVPDLVLADDVDARTARFGRLSTLIRWHCADPVSVEEVQRHDVAAAAQGNRNAFVDSPDLANEVFGFACD